MDEMDIDGVYTPPKSKQVSKKEAYLMNLARSKNRYRECLQAAIEVLSEEFPAEMLNPSVIVPVATSFFIENNRKM